MLAWQLVPCAAARAVDPIPPSDADVAAVTDAARAINAAAGACLELRCPNLDCTTATALLRALLAAESTLDAMLDALVDANDDALAHFEALTADGMLTATQLAQAQEAQAVQESLHNFGSLLLDIASLASFAKGFAEGKLDEASLLNKLDTTYESIKDFESAVDTLADACGAGGTTAVSGVTGQAVGALGAPNATPENMGAALNDLKSQFGDLRDGLKAAADNEVDAEAIGQMAGRVLKVYSQLKLAERARLIDGFVDGLGRNAEAVAEAARTLRRVRERRDAVEDALAAVAAARERLLSCVIRI